LTITIRLWRRPGKPFGGTSSAAGVVAFGPAGNRRQTLTFDQLSARQELRFTAAGKDWVLPVDGVDATRERGKLTLYTPMYHADTDTAAGGTEIVASGKPLTVRTVRSDAGHTVIYVSHQLGEVLRLADRVAVLRAGRLAAVETTEGLTRTRLAELLPGRRLEVEFPPPARTRVAPVSSAPGLPVAPAARVAASRRRISADRGAAAWKRRPTAESSGRRIAWPGVDLPEPASPAMPRGLPR